MYFSVKVLGSIPRTRKQTLVFIFYNGFTQFFNLACMCVGVRARGWPQFQSSLNLLHKKQIYQVEQKFGYMSLQHLERAIFQSFLRSLRGVYGTELFPGSEYIIHFGSGDSESHHLGFSLDKHGIPCPPMWCPEQLPHLRFPVRPLRVNSSSCSFTFVRISQEWNHTVHHLWNLVTLTRPNALKILSCCWRLNQSSYCWWCSIFTGITI